MTLSKMRMPTHRPHSRRAAAGLILCLAVMSGANTPGAARAASTKEAGMEKVVRMPAVGPVGRDFSVRLPESGNVIFMGERVPSSLNSADGAIPSVDILVSLAALTGKYIREYGEQEKRQAKANEVLAPYQPILGGYTHRELFQRALEKTSPSGTGRLVEFSDSSTGGWRVEMNPVFTLTQDQSAWILDNDISIHAPGSPAGPAYQGAIRVISDPRTEPDIIRFWTAREGAALREESARLVAHSLEIAWREMNGGSWSAGGSSNSNSGSEAEATPLTFRYRQGKTERMERARPVVMRCGRAVIRTLRGTLMSVPFVPPVDAAEVEERGCGDRLANVFE